MIIDIGTILNAIAPGSAWQYRGSLPTTEAEFNAGFNPLDDRAATITWTAYQTKKTELDAAEPMAELRRQRDRLLAETDWWGVTDRTMSAEETAYRQALRDMPANNPSPTLSGENNDIIGNITWPTKP